MRAVSVAMNSEIENKIGELMAHRTPQLSDGQRRVAAAVMMNLVKSVLPAIEGRGEPERSEIIEAFKQLGTIYMESMVL
jgi:hypothetical protein